MNDNGLGRAQAEYDRMEPPDDGGEFERWMESNHKALVDHFKEHYVEEHHLDYEAWDWKTVQRFYDFCEREYQKNDDAVWEAK